VPPIGVFLLQEMAERKMRTMNKYFENFILIF
jgi:hypothetical protein